MSEYIGIETEISDDGSHIYFYTNLRLTDQGVEEYHDTAAMEEGSPVAQALAVIEGIAHLRLEADEMLITPHPDAAWHAIVADVSAALKDFFL
jgi:reverse gyrase